MSKAAFDTSAPDVKGSWMRRRHLTLRRRVAVIVGIVAAAAGLLVVPTSAHATGFVATALADDEVFVPGQPVPPGAVEWFVPPKVGSGDADFKGHGPKVTAGVDRFVSADRKLILVRLEMTAEEWDGGQPKSDFTKADGRSPLYGIYQAPTGRCIATFSVPSTAITVGYVDHDHDIDIFTGHGPGPDPLSVVNWFEFVGDTSGPEAGTKTGMRIVTSDLLVTLTSC